MMGKTHQNVDCSGKGLEILQAANWVLCFLGLSPAELFWSGILAAQVPPWGLDDAAGSGGEPCQMAVNFGPKPPSVCHDSKSCFDSDP